MTCLECNKELSYLDHKDAMETLGVELCAQHMNRMVKLIETNGTPQEAILLYYGLKEEGIHPMLEWWDGQKSIDVAISRVKLNIEIDTEYQKLTHEQALNELEGTMHSYNNGFTTIRIPDVLVRHYFRETVQNILGIVESLKTTTKTI